MCGSCAGGSLARHGFQAGGAFKRVGMAARVLVLLLLQRLGGTSGHAAAGTRMAGAAQLDASLQRKKGTESYLMRSAEPRTEVNMAACLQSMGPGMPWLSR